MAASPLPPDPAKVISVRSRDGMANRMIQYMAALALCDKIEGCVITGVNLPEWNVPHVDDPDTDGFARIVKVTPSNVTGYKLGELAAFANRSSSVIVFIEDYMQRLACLDHPSRYAALFPAQAAPEVADSELLIHIRADDLLLGVLHYPLLPVHYYRWLIHKSGLSPVFCGQIGHSTYGRLIRSEFPDARFIESGTAVEDFSLIRSARHIALSVSTYAWLAAWLSNATTIYLPLCGFLSPVSMRQIDLLPTADPRYRFIHFPLFFGMPEAASLEHHLRIAGTWREISPGQVALLRDLAPFLPARTEALPFEHVWYTHQYLDAAMEISEGWFRDALHHYLEVGQLRGHQPTRLGLLRERAPLPGTNLARRGQALQSSVSLWSGGKTVEADAAIAIDGRVWEDKFFHTENELKPWWRVDLLAAYWVTRIRIFNRDGHAFIQMRAAPLLVEGSIDGRHWYLLFETEPDQIIGGRSGKPLIWDAPRPVLTRFVKVTIPREEFLHLAEVEVYGTERLASQPAGIGEAQ